ncbi:hypothetical protein COHA_005208 [Chlorella ohadii]|uniref:Uncharacterized protein n=1 Tax=Chlorella ohadii TaxID=2649997 RepID=A0AAD5H1T3_9CHLO|nr:hypothetical protein COHA_005208 [Chlorella ohadii]
MQQGAAPQRQQQQQAGVPQRQQAPPGAPQRTQQPPGPPQRQGFAPQRQGYAPPQQQGRRPARPEPKDDLFARLADECGLEDAWRPQVLLLYELGLRPSDFDRLAESRPEIFQMGIVTMRRKLKFLQDTIGLSNAQLAKVISKFPRILEYRSERTLRPRLDFLARCGVSQDDLAKVFVKAPMVLELSVKDTLEPRAAFLRKTLSLPADALGKLIVRHPQALTCTQDMMAQRVEFLLQQGLSQEEVGRAVLAHPQVLHYKIDSMRERVDYLQNVGLTQAQVAACAHRFPQLFSLDVAANLDPKWRYLTDYICASGADCVDTLCSYPGYFSLSLTNRIVPRHRFFLHTAPKRGASPDPSQLVFPMNALKSSDAQFVKLCGSSLEEYEQFRAALFGGAQPPPSVHPAAAHPSSD